MVGEASGVARATHLSAANEADMVRGEARIMPTVTKNLLLEKIDSTVDERHKFSLDILLGLSERPKRISSKYIYDEEGSRLFQEITRLPEYYPTKCEYDILAANKSDILQMVADRPFQIVELGAGDGHKTEVLIRHFLEAGLDFRYVPIDISEAALEMLCGSFEKKYPGLDMLAIVAEYFDALKWLTQSGDQANLVLFLGSNIGNFSRSQTHVFLRSLWNSLNPDDRVLIGFDLKKDIELLLRAYNDSKGVTAAFNKNLLQRINRILGGNFDLSKFRHYATYDVFSGAMESYLVSLEPQIVTVREMGEAFTFEAWEPIHTEYSYKYLESDIVEIARETGFLIEKQMFDERHWFVDSLWRVHKPLKL
jgi:dimethylhistidine N-methyltransferase